jgi:ABC-2 type transport system ATP-binding protein
MKLELKNINKSIGDKKILKDVNLTVNSGTAFGLLGKNGAGKTTTSKIIMNLLEQDTGEVLIDGIQNTKCNVKIGYLPEERGLDKEISVAKHMIYIGELRGLGKKEAKARAKFLLDKLQIEEHYNKKIKTLSKGNQQKVQLAISIINDPDIIILDEPFSGLDPINAIILKDLVIELINDKKVVLISSHQMSFVESFCQNIGIINQGEIVLEGSLKEIKNRYQSEKILITTKKDHSLIQKLKDENCYIKDLVQQNDDFIITVSSIEDKQVILSQINSLKIDIDNFKVIKPTLEEIFIESVGEKNEKL